MKTITTLMQESIISEAKMNVYTMIAKGSGENWAIVAASKM